MTTQIATYWRFFGLLLKITFFCKKVNNVTFPEIIGIFSKGLTHIFISNKKKWVTTRRLSPILRIESKIAAFLFFDKFAFFDSRFFTHQTT